MGRKSKAEIVIEKFEDEAENGGKFLTIYDFHPRVATGFYRNLHKVLKRFHGELVQLSVIHSDTRRCALAARELAWMYGADVKVYEVIEEI